MKIAVVGSGISGLSAAYYLSKKHHVDLFEREDHFGGHSNTIDIFFDEKKVSVDIGFIVFNFQTYPNLINFFKEKIVFTGDTLFSLGCGRIFEGSYEEMFESLNKIKLLPEDTKIYCGHEYTLKNAKFCKKYDSENKDLQKKIEKIEKLRENGIPTIPSTLKEELECNIFLRAKDVKTFSKLRDFKDNF